VVKWKSTKELAEEKRVREQFRARFRASHAGLESSDEFMDLGIDYATYIGLNLSSPGDSIRLAGDLSKVCANSSAWLYRGILHVSTLKTAYAESIYGIATLTDTGEQMTIVSRPGKAAFEFHGDIHDARISGQLELTAGAVVCPATAEGVLLPRKISLDSRGQTAADVVRGSFTLLR
jgi:hypothetical protein